MHFKWQNAYYVLLPLALLPIALVTYYVATRAGSGPVGDQWWDVAYIAINTRSGQLTIEDIFFRFQGHRPVIVRLMTVISTLLTDYDTRLLRFAAVANATINVSLAVYLLKIRAGKLALLGAPVFAVILLTLHCPDSWLDYYFVVWQQPLFFLLTAGIVLQKMRPGIQPFLIVLLCAIFATFTLGLGIAAWFSLPLAIFVFPTYRRWYFVVGWIACCALCMKFYTSGFAVNPHEGSGKIVYLQIIRGLDPLTVLAYLVKFQSGRFNAGSENLMAVCLTILCFIMMVANFIFVLRRGERTAAAIWATLALFSFGGAALTMIGRGVPIPVPTRFSPGSDGFWLGFAGLAFIAMLNRPRPILAIANIALLATVLVMSIQKDIWSFETDEGPDTAKCDRCILDYPLRRDDCFQTCFPVADEQSVYHMAALRLSLFSEEKPMLALPESGGTIILDMPNRWLAVYVRDYMLPGIQDEAIFTIAPENGALRPPQRPYSPYYRGELSTDSFPHPLINTWKTVDSFLPKLKLLLKDGGKVWVLNTPETDLDFSTLEAAFLDMGYRGRLIKIANQRYSQARFQLWSFERSD